MTREHRRSLGCWELVRDVRRARKGHSMARYHRIDRDLKKRRDLRYKLRAKSSQFIPDADSDFASMAKFFAGYIGDHAERLPVSKEQVADLREAVSAFRDALAR